jgi:hypothetical protein
MMTYPDLLICAIVFAVLAALTMIRLAKGPTAADRMVAGDADFEYEYKPVSGTFTTAERELSYEVSLSGSDAFPSGLVFQDERLMEESIYGD